MHLFKCHFPWESFLLSWAELLLSAAQCHKTLLSKEDLNFAAANPLFYVIPMINWCICCVM